MKTKILLLITLLATFYASAQNVGIGTSNPTDQLHTTGSIRFGNYKGNGIRPLLVDDSGRVIAGGAAFNNNTSTAIPDNGCSTNNGVVKMITVSGMPTAITASNIAIQINIDHPFVSDLYVYLVAPNGQVLPLATGNGGNGDNFTNTIFTDAAANSISTGTAPFSGQYKPMGDIGSPCFSAPGSFITTFAAFGGGGIIPNGTWILKVYDNGSSDVGTFKSWSISFSGSGVIDMANNEHYIPQFKNGGLVKSNIIQNPVTGNIGISSNPAFIADQKFTVDGRLQTEAGASLGGDVSITGDLLTSGGIATDAGLFVSDDATITGNILTDADLFVGNNASVSHNVTIGDSLFAERIGVGTTTPTQKLDIKNGRIRFSGDPSANNVQGIEFTKADGVSLNGFLGKYNDSMIGFYGYTGAGWKTLFNNTNGNIGLQGNSNPRAPLSFASNTGNKIALWGNADLAHYGFGIQGSLMQLYTSDVNADIAFGYGSSTAFTELMRVKGNGNVGIGTPSPTEKLQVNGNVKATGNVSINGAMQVGNDATFGSNTTIYGVLQVQDNTVLSSNVTIGGTVKIQGGNPGLGKVLISDAAGNASWQNQAVSVPQSTAFFAALASDWAIPYWGTPGSQTAVPFVDNTALNLINPTSDNGSSFNNTTHSYVAPTSGLYHFSFKVNYELGGVNMGGGPTPDFYMKTSLHVVDVSGDHEIAWPMDKYISNSPAPHGQEGSIDLKLQAGSSVYVSISSDNYLTINMNASDNNRFVGYKIY